jgi:hypothetical protein
MIRIVKPKTPFAQWMESFNTRNPRMADFAVRWDEWEPGQEEVRDNDNWVTQSAKPPRPKEVGEQNAYLAWTLGVMEKAEADQFSMLSIRWDVLAQFAVVPIIREMVGTIGELQRAVSVLKGALKDAEARLDAIEIDRAEQKRTAELAEEAKDRQSPLPEKEV